MGRLVQGQWVSDDFVRKNKAFQRATTSCRDSIGDAQFPPSSGRYHLYVSLACPWAHRALIVRQLKGLTDHIGVSVVSPLMGGDGWTFSPDFDGSTGDAVGGHAFLRDVYTTHDNAFSGRVSVPILLDTTTNTIVNNESSEIIRQLDTQFGALADSDITLRPTDLVAQIDQVNERVYNDLNNGVYKCGFAGSQEAYDDAVTALFSTLDWVEDRLSETRYVAGDRLTEADVRLFTTLVRFDAVYAFHFRCNLRLLRDYKNVSAYLRELYSVPAFRDTTDLSHIRHHYYRSHESIHPSRIVPVGPELHIDAPHDRDRFGGLDPVASSRKSNFLAD